jgi:hypothetical protein
MPLTATRAVSIGLDLSDDELFSNIAEFSLSCLTHGRYVSVACAIRMTACLSHRVSHHSYCLGISTERMFARESAILRHAVVWWLWRSQMHTVAAALSRCCATLKKFFGISLFIAWQLVRTLVI